MCHVASGVLMRSEGPTISVFVGGNSSSVAPALSSIVVLVVFELLRDGSGSNLTLSALLARFFLLEQE